MDTFATYRPADLIDTGNLFEDVRHMLPVERMVWTKAAIKRARDKAIAADDRQRLEELDRTQPGELDGLEAWRGLPVPALPVRTDDDASIRIPVSYVRRHAELAARLPAPMTRRQLIRGGKPSRGWRPRYWQERAYEDTTQYWEDVNEYVMRQLGRDPRTGEPL